MASPSPALPSREDVLDRFARIVANSLRIDPSRVTPETTLDDLGAESIDIVEITFDCEHEFSVLMPERTILEAGADVLGPGVLERDGALTDAGVRLLAARMPSFDRSEFPDPVRVVDLRRVFLRVDVWVGLIQLLLERSPRTCPACGSALEQGSPGRLACPGCGREVALASGDEVNRDWVREHATALSAPPGEAQG